MTDASKFAPLHLNIAGQEEKIFTKSNQPSQNAFHTKSPENLSNKDLYEQYERTIQENLEEITRLDDYKKIFLVTGIIFSLIFLILLLVKIILFDQKNESKMTPSQFTYYFLLIPAALSIICFTIWANFYLRMNEIFDRAHKRIRNEENESYNFGNFLSYFTVNFTCLCVIAYVVLLAVKIQNYDSPGTQSVYNTFNLIAIPCYFTYGILLLYFIFVIPAFLLNGWYFLTILLASYMLCSFVTFLLINFRLDNIISLKYLFIFAPLLFAVFLNLVYIGMKISNEYILKIMMDFTAVLCFFVGLDLIALRLDGHINQSYLPIIFIIIGLLLLINYKEIFCKDEEDKEVNT
jgi:hypothetical protein